MLSASYRKQRASWLSILDPQGPEVLELSRPVRHALTRVAIIAILVCWRTSAVFSPPMAQQGAPRHTNHENTVRNTWVHSQNKFLDFVIIVVDCVISVHDFDFLQYLLNSMFPRVSYTDMMEKDSNSVSIFIIKMSSLSVNTK